VTGDATHGPSGFNPTQIERPDAALMTYYLWVALITVAGFPFVVIPLWCKYHTLRYRFDDKGVSMSWGLLFRREIYLTYRRIQDIHVTRNLFHRWLGLGAISIQTASGTSGAEMTIEGVKKVEALRDYLYTQMRGAKGNTTTSGESTLTGEETNDSVVALLTEIRDELRRVRGRQETKA